MLPVENVADDGLADAGAPTQVHLRHPAALHVCAQSRKSFFWFHHMTGKSIGIADYFASGGFDTCLPYSFGMAKASQSSFYDRAVEAFKDRYPRVKFTQWRLAAEAGVRQSTVNDWKDGVPTMETTVELAKRLNVCVEWLYTGRGPKRIPDGPEVPIASWSELDREQREQIARYADFVRAEKKK